MQLYLPPLECLLCVHRLKTLLLKLPFVPRDIKERNRHRQQDGRHEKRQDTKQTRTAVKGLAQGRDIGKTPLGTDVGKEFVQRLNVFTRIIGYGRERIVRGRKSEVDKLDIEAVAGDEDIVRLEVVVDKLKAVDVLKRIQELEEDPFASGFGRLGLPPLFEGHTINPLLNNAPPYPADFLQRVSGCYIGMYEPYSELELMLLLQAVVGKSRRFGCQCLEQETPAVTRSGIDLRVRTTLHQRDIPPLGRITFRHNKTG